MQPQRKRQSKHQKQKPPASIGRNATATILALILTLVAKENLTLNYNGATAPKITGESGCWH